MAEGTGMRMFLACVVCLRCLFCDFSSNTHKYIICIYASLQTCTVFFGFLIKSKLPVEGDINVFRISRIITDNNLDDDDERGVPDDDVDDVSDVDDDVDDDDDDDLQVHECVSNIQKNDIWLWVMSPVLYLSEHHKKLK